MLKKQKQTSTNAEQRYPDDMCRYWRKKYNALGTRTQEIKDNHALIPYLGCGSLSFKVRIYNKNALRFDLLIVQNISVKSLLQTKMALFV